KTEGGTGRQQEKDYRSRGSHAEAWARHGTVLKHMRSTLVMHRAISRKVHSGPRTQLRLETVARAPAAPRAAPAPPRPTAAGDALPPAPALQAHPQCPRGARGRATGQ